MDIKAHLEKLLDWYYHKGAVRFMKRKYRSEIASQRISENYLTQLILDYPGEDQKKANLRQELLNTQQTLQNLELLMKFLKIQK
jgi:hypothetical protein